MLTDDKAAELNEEVARAMGWERRSPQGVLREIPTYEIPPYEVPPYEIPPYWISPGRFTSPISLPGFVNLPDFARDPHSFGWLLEWCDWQCARLGARFHYHAGRDWEGKGFADVYYHLVQHCDTPGDALARAIVAYAEAQKQGGQKAQKQGGQKEQEARDGH